MGTVDQAMVLDRPPLADFPPGEEPVDTWDVVEPKMDGIWGQLIIDRSGVLTIWSRHGQCKHRERTLLPQMHLHGEFMHGSHWGIQNGHDGKFFAFDIVGWRGADIRHRPLIARRRRLERVPQLFKVPRLELVPQFPAEQWRDHWAGLVMGQGFEGLMFKRLREPFGAVWGRMKRRFTVDYVFMGVTISEADKYKGKGMAQSIQAGLFVDGKLERVANIMGLTEAQRLDFARREHDLIGRVFEASGRGIYPSGGLRHPNFERWRDPFDKAPWECIKPGLDEADAEEQMKLARGGS